RMVPSRSFIMVRTFSDASSWGNPWIMRKWMTSSGLSPQRILALASASTCSGFAGATPSLDTPGRDAGADGPAATVWVGAECDNERAGGRDVTGGGEGGAAAGAGAGAGSIGLKMVICPSSALACSVPFAPQPGQAIVNGIRLLTGSTSNLYFWPQAQWI